MHSYHHETEEQGAIAGRGAKRGGEGHSNFGNAPHLCRWFKKDFYQVAQQRFNKSHNAHTFCKVPTYLVKFNLIFGNIMEFNCQNLTANRRF